MARPRKCRRVCGMPQSNSFVPIGDLSRIQTVKMTLDEYETLRLIDLAGYTQEECAQQMEIARTTVQGIYNDARRKVADALVNGKMLSIEGGDVALCKGDTGCGKKCRPLCCKQTNQEDMQKNEV